MRKHVLFLLVLLPLVAGCAANQSRSTPQIARQPWDSSAVPSSEESRTLAEADLHNVRFASLANVALPQDAPLESISAAPQSELYRLRYGDVIAVKFVRNPELDVTAAVRPDGNISLPMVGEVMAKGTTLPDLRTTISQQYKNFITQTGYGEY